MNLRTGWTRGKLLSLLAICLFSLLLPGCLTLPDPKSTSAANQLAPELVFYNWIGDLPGEVLDAFYNEFGVQVRYESYISQDEAIENLKAGKIYDVVVLDNRFITELIEAGMLAELSPGNIPNIKHISKKFRGPAFDPQNKYSLPYNWGTTGLVVRSDLAGVPMVGWNSLWNPGIKGKVILWKTSPRETLGLSLKSLGYSINSENPVELEKALDHLVQLKPNILFVEDINDELESSASLLVNGFGVAAMGYTVDYYEAKTTNHNINYILPEEGTMIWNDNFVIPANSPNRYTAEVFLNFLLRPEISALITNFKYYPTPNEAAIKYINPLILNDPLVFPRAEDLKKAEQFMPLSPQGEQLVSEIWERFLTAP